VRITDNELTGVDSSYDVRLFKALAEDLRAPLLQIARGSELANSGSGTAADLKSIETTADATLKLIDSYLFSTQVMLGQQKLELEPVSVKAIMYDTAHYLDKMCKLYDQQIELQIHARNTLVMAHPQAMQAALISLAHSFISSFQRTSPQQIILTAQKTGYATTTGIMTTGTKLSQQSLNKARQLFGNIRQPLRQHTHANMAGIYVADSLFAAMQSTLKVKNEQQHSGLAAILLPSQQLSLL